MTIPARYLIPALVAFVAGCGGEGEMERFTAPTEGFTVLMPGTPKKQTKTGQLPDGSTLSIDMYVIDLGKKAYVVSGSDLPNAAAVANAPPDRVLDGSRDGAIRGMPGAAIVNERPLELKGYPGREIEFTFTPAPNSQTQGVGRMRIYLVDGKLYQAMVLDTSGQPIGKNGETFLKSFTLTKGGRKRPD